MYRHEIVPAVLSQRIIGIIRAPDAISAVKHAETMIHAGMRSIEITLTNPEALEAITHLTQEHPETVIGAGTVLDAASALLAIRAGARFLVSPHLDRDIVDTAHRHGAAALPGVGSVTEIVQALAAGADALKLFPASNFTPRWITDVQAALPHAPLVPTGGITPDDVPAWIKAGAVACAIGSALTTGPADQVRSRIKALLADANAYSAAKSG